MRLPRRADPGGRLHGSAFVGFRFPPDVIVLAVRWYLRFGLAYRDVEELLAERGIEVDHVTIHRWVKRFAPLLVGRDYTGGGPGMVEELVGRLAVPSGGGVHVDDLPELVHRPVQVDPPAGHLHLRLVDVPAVPGPVPGEPGHIDQQRAEAPHPAWAPSASTHPSSGSSATSRMSVRPREPAS